MKSSSIFAVLSIAALSVFAGCSPSPEKVCNHVMEIAEKEMKADKESAGKMSEDDKKKALKDCVAEGEKKKAENKTKFDCEAKCLMGAADMKSLGECEKSCKS